MYLSFRENNVIHAMFLALCRGLCDRRRKVLYSIDRRETLQCSV